MFHKYLTKSYICATLILIVCLLPGNSFPTVEVQWISLDKLVHLVMYIPMTWTLAYGFKYQNKYPSLEAKSLLYAFIISSLYGAFIEFLQFAITPDRAAELFDLVADVAGAALGVLTYSWGERLIRVWNKIFQYLSSIWDVRDY